ncbi:MAG TPA: class I SAM-dependent methyltransferase [Sphingomicrobium sp.]|nr:class I SAM-dependent methyltransferase [Sphingomicrobium sp.]
MGKNIDEHTAAGFDLIWRRYAASEPRAAESDRAEAFDTYFAIFPLDRLAGAQGFDLGCGNGRIAVSVAPRAGFLHCIDPSAAGLASVKQAMRDRDNVDFHQASVESIPLPDASQDFGYSIGVLHHVPDPAAGLQRCVDKLKPGAPFLLYLYYSLDNRPGWFRLVWRASDVARRIICRLPFPLRVAASTGFAAIVYWPLSRSARLLGKLGVATGNLPLSGYSDSPWAVLRADALDRFGTAIEHRFSRAEIERMMLDAGLSDVRFAEGPPFWIALGYKA